MKKGIDLRAIIMSLFVLAAIFLIMLQLQRIKPTGPEVIQRLPRGERIGIVDSSYINLPFSFLWTMPNNNWHISMLSQDTLAPSLLSVAPLLDQFDWIAAAIRSEGSETLATCRIGVAAVDSNETAHDLAVNILAELLAKLEAGNERATILQPATSPAHQILKGAYFVAAPAGDKVHFVVLLPRKNKMFILFCRVLEKEYDLLREELQEIVQRFHPLPSISL